MPNTSEPKISDWVSHLKKIAGSLDNKTILVGHSMGCQTIMRYLENLPKDTKVAGLVFVAGWFDLRNLEDKEVEQIANPWLTTGINLEKVKERAGKITVFLSKNDPYNCFDENQKKFKEDLSAEVIIEEKGHFTAEDGVTEMPEVLKKIEEIA